MFAVLYLCFLRADAFGEMGALTNGRISDGFGGT